MLRENISGRTAQECQVIGFLDFQGLTTFLAVVVIAGWLPASEPPSSADPASVPVYAASPVANNLFAEASAEFNRDRFDVAAAKFQLFVSRYPEDPLAAYAQHYIGVSSLRRGELKDASAMFAKVVRSTASVEIKQESLFHFGWCLFQLAEEGRPEMLDQAATVFRLLREQYPNSDRVEEACFFQAEVNFKAGKFKDAQPAYREFVDHYRESSRRSDALFGLALVERELGNEEIANRYFDELIESYPRDRRTASIQFEAAERSFKAGQYERAEKLYANVLAANDHAQADLALVRRATSFAKLGKNVQAAELFEQLPVRFSNSPHVNEAWLAAGHHFFWADKFKDAERCLAHIIENELPAADKASHWLVRCHMERGKPHRALEVADTALKREPQTVVRHNLLLDRADALAELPARHNDAFIAYATTLAEADLPFLVVRAIQGMLDIGRTDRHHEYIVKVATKVVEERSENDVIIAAKVAVATAQMNLGNTSETTRIYRELLADYADNEAASDWVTNAGWAAVLSEDYQAALDLVSRFGDSVDSRGLDSEANLICGFALAKLERYAEAVPKLEEVVRMAPESPNAADAMESLVRCYRLTEQQERAQETVNRLIRQDPNRRNSAALQLDMAELALSQGNDSVAEDYYENIIASETDEASQADRLHRLAWIKIRKSQVDDAERLLTRLIKRYSNHELATRAYLDRARCYQLLDKHGAAIADLWKVLEAKPDSKKLQATAVFALGISFIHEDRIDDALSAFSTISEDFADYSRADEALFQLGALLHKQSKPKEAKVAFERLVHEHPNSELAASAKFHLGQMNYDNHENAAAIELFRGAINDAGAKLFMDEVYYRLGWACYRDHDFAGARDAFQAQLARDPSGEFAHDSRFMLAESQYEREDWSKAIALYRPLVDDERTTSNMQVAALLHLGRAAIELGSYGDGAAALGRIVRDHAESPSRAEAEFSLGVCRAREEKFVTAGHHFEVAATSGSRGMAARARYELARMYADQEEYDRSMRESLTVMHALEVSEGESEIQAIQAKAAQSAADCATTLASLATSDVERDQLLERAARYWGYVVEKRPNSLEARKARASMEAMVAHGPSEILLR